MAQQSLLNDSANLFELLCHEQTLNAAFKVVKANNSSPGTDGVSVNDFAKRKDKELDTARPAIEANSMDAFCTMALSAKGKSRFFDHTSPCKS